MSDVLTRVIEWSPAYNKLDDGYGRGTVKVRFVVKGAKGAVHFVLATGWYASKDRLDDDRRGGVRCRDGLRRAIDARPVPMDLGYHSPAPRYQGQTTTQDTCPYLDGAACYYDGSGLNAEDPFDVLTDDGVEALWTFLERFYGATFEGGEYPSEFGRRWNFERAEAGL